MCLLAGPWSSGLKGHNARLGLQGLDPERGETHGDPKTSGIVPSVAFVPKH